jgi:hypothetical protein
VDAYTKFATCGRRPATRETAYGSEIVSDARGRRMVGSSRREGLSFRGANMSITTPNVTPPTTISVSCSAPLINISKIDADVVIVPPDAFRRMAPDCHPPRRILALRFNARNIRVRINYDSTKFPAPFRKTVELQRLACWLEKRSSLKWSETFAGSPKLATRAEWGPVAKPRARVSQMLTITSRADRQKYVGATNPIRAC